MDQRRQLYGDARRCNRLGALLVVLMAGCQSAPPPSALPLALETLEGLWFDIAHLPHPIQEGCRNSVSLYRPQEDASDSLRFLFECQLEDDLWYTVEGNASRRPADGDRVVFDFDDPLIDAGVNMQFWLLSAAPDAAWLVVGSPDDHWLWILSREPSLAPDVVDAIVRELQTQELYSPERIANDLTYTAHTR